MVVGGGGCILVIPEVRGGGEYGSRLWYGMDIF